MNVDTDGACGCHEVDDVLPPLDPHCAWLHRIHMLAKHLSIAKPISDFLVARGRSRDLREPIFDDDSGRETFPVSASMCCHWPEVHVGCVPPLAWGPETPQARVG